jgi:hypothetical protein
VTTGVANCIASLVCCSPAKRNGKVEVTTSLTCALSCPASQDLADNNLGPQLPEVLLCLQGLQSLSLNSTGLTALPEAMSQLSKLTWLDLSDNLVELDALPVASLLHLRQLCVLKVGGAPPSGSRGADPQATAVSSTTSSCSTQQQGTCSVPGTSSASTQLSHQQVAAELKSKLTRLRCCHLRATC